MRRFAAGWLLLVAVWHAAVADESPAAVSVKSTCELRSPTYDSHQVTCSIPASAAARHLEFEADYSGGHDDTLVSIEPMLDGKPLTCEDGSKIRSFAEDGDIRLRCRFTVAGPANATFQATIHWSHAQYAGYELLTR